jgi:hypothetical protein
MSSLAKGVSSKLTAFDRDFQFAARETRVSNIIQTGARDRPKLTNVRRFPSPTASARTRLPVFWCDVCVPRTRRLLGTSTHGAIDGARLDRFQGSPAPLGLAARFRIIAQDGDPARQEENYLMSGTPELMRACRSLSKRGRRSSIVILLRDRLQSTHKLGQWRGECVHAYST